MHVWNKPGLSGYLVCLIHLVSLMQPNKPDRPNEKDRLVDFFSILLDRRRQRTSLVGQTYPRCFSARWSSSPAKSTASAISRIDFRKSILCR